MLLRDPPFDASPGLSWGLLLRISPHGLARGTPRGYSGRSDGSRPVAQFSSGRRRCGK